MEAAPNAIDDGILQGEQAGAEPHPVGSRILILTSTRVLANHRAIPVVHDVVDPTAAQTPVLVFDGHDLLQGDNRISRSL